MRPCEIRYSVMLHESEEFTCRRVASRLDRSAGTRRTHPPGVSREHVAGAVANTVVEQIPPRLQLFAETVDAFLRALQRTDAAELHHRRDVARGVEQHLLHPVPQLRICNSDVAKAQPRHRIRLAEREQRQRLFVAAGERGRTHVFPFEDNVLVGFVRDQPQAALVGRVATICVRSSRLRTPPVGLFGELM